jgi:pimeloyl-ACP methyl ester carboxylesterase
VISDDELLTLDEFALLGENAAQAGYAEPLPAVERVERGPISVLRWGSDPVRVVFLHGGGQNAHTWDTVILGLGLPALAVDLPGHGRSAWREDGDYGPKLNAAAVEAVVRELAPDADLVVGMSLGGLTALRLGAVALVQGDRSFPSFAAMVDITVAASPQRSRESLRRGVFHNSQQLDDGTWTWRYDTFRKGDGFEGLWDDAAELRAPTTLVRGANSYFVNDDDAAEFARIAPGFQRVIVVPDSGHSVQGDQPRALVEILQSVIGD